MKKRLFHYFAAILILCVLPCLFIPTIAKGQVTLSGTSYTQNFDDLGAGLPEGWSVYSNAINIPGTSATFSTTKTNWNTSAGGFANFASAVSGATTLTSTQTAATDRALGVRQTGSLGDPGAAFRFEVANTQQKRNFKLMFDIQSLDITSPRSVTWKVQYSTNGSSWADIQAAGTLTTGGNSFLNNPISVDFGNVLDNNSTSIYIQIIATTNSTGSGNRPTTAIDNFILTWEADDAPSCLAPSSLTTTSLHTPTWYNARLNWTLPEGASTVSASTTTIFDNGPIVNRPGAASGGADGSLYLTNPNQTASRVCKNGTNTVADDFVLEKETLLSAVEFYVYVKATTVPADIEEAYITLYDGDPSAGAAVVWGGQSINCIESVVDPGIYQIYPGNLGYTSRKLMRVRASFNNFSLAPGTYWIEMSVKNSDTSFPYTAAVMNDDGTTTAGNAKYCTISTGAWSDWKSNNIGATWAFTLYGKTVNTDITGYNIYRNNVKLNTEPLTVRHYLDLTPGEGSYTYGVTAIYSTCESVPTTHIVDMGIWMCDVPNNTFPYLESFESTTGTAFPSECWRQEKDVNNYDWTTVAKTTGQPNCTPDNSTRKAIFSSRASGVIGAKSKLIMPQMDISSLLRPSLSFYRAQALSVAKLDTLRIYYKSTNEAEWTLLKEYTTPTPTSSSLTTYERWSHETVSLPDPSANYQIAFEAALGRGNGIMLDVIEIKTGDLCSPVEGFDVTVQDNKDAVLTWTTPSDATPSSYKIYKNNSLITTISATSYTDLNLSPGSYSYCVAAIYPTCESEDACGEAVINEISACTAPQNLTSVLHDPSWYNVKLAWDMPAGGTTGAASTTINNGPIINRPGEGYNGADVSFYAITTPAQSAWSNIKAGSYGIADDFTITQETVLSSLEFYAFQPNSGTTPTINKACVTIYDGDPSAGGQAVWGDRTTNVLHSVEFINAYRTTTTLTNGMLNNQRPIMRVKVLLNDLHLATGTYWVEIAADGTMSNNGPFTVPVMGADGISIEGNAKSYSFSTNVWGNWNSGGRGAALPFILYGSSVESDVAGYNVYRDDIKINSSLISGRSYLDIAPGQGTYTYAVTAVYTDDCESNKTTHEVDMPIYPCEVAITTFPYFEGFEGGSMPSCWTQEKDDKDIAWEVIAKTTGTPNTTPDNSSYKLRLTSALPAKRGARTKLVMPMLDISNLPRPAVSFWHAQRTGSGYQDTLRVYYKDAPTADWTMLAEYTDNITTWVEEKINLPNPSATYWIAFEGAIGMAYGVMLDAITVDVRDVCPPIEDLTGYVWAQKDVVLHWTAPANEVAPSSYKIYRDNVFLAETPATTYTDTDLAPNIYNYCIEVIYNNNCGVSAQVCRSFTITEFNNCNEPLNLTTSMHDPDWYNVQLQWNSPEPMGEVEILDQSQLITDPGAGYGGADVSATEEDGTDDMSYAMSYTSHWAIADDFTLAEATFITDIDFFGYVNGSGTTSAFTGLNVMIYNGDPSVAGTQVVWGNSTKNSLKSASFTGIYRTRPSNMQSTDRPIMKITAAIDTLLPAGTYWVKYSTTAGAYTWALPVSIKGQPITGNAKQFVPPDDQNPAGYWREMIESTSGANKGAALVVHGSGTYPIGYKVFRNDELLTPSTIAQREYLDLTPGQGSYTYTVSAIWNTGTCESQKSVPVVVEMPETPCATPFTVISESFDATKFPPLCWTVTGTGDYVRRIAVSGYPACTPHSGTGMLSFNSLAYPTGTKGTIATPAFSTSAGTYLLTFWMYRDNNNEMGRANRADYVNVYLNSTTDISSLTPLKTVHRSTALDPVVATEGWYQYQVVLNCTAIPTAAHVILEGVSANGNNMLIDDITIAPLESWSITATAGTNGTITPSGPITVLSGGNQTFVISSNAGYKIKSVLVDGAAETAAVGASSYSYTFTNVTANHTISAEFEQITYTIATTSGSGGSISPAGTATVTHGNNQTYTITADAGYKIKSVLVDGTAETAAVGASSYSYTFSNVTANHTISAEFEQNIFTITATAGTNGTIAPNGATTLTYGDSQEYTITANEGYKIKSVLVDDVAETAAVGASSYSYTFSNVTANHTISAEFEQITYTITATAGANGSITPGGATTVSYGSNQAYTITASNDYLIKEVKVDGIAESAAVGKTTYNYTFSNVKANHTISATFEIANPELTGITVNNQPQTISSAMDYMAACGEQSVSMTLTAVGEVKVNGAAYTNGSPISLTGDKTVITITVTAGSNIATYTLTVAKALGSTTPLYIERWGATLAIVNNPANNGGYTFDQIQWYKASDNTPAGTGAYVVGNISTHYADVHAVETGAWHHTCRTKATPAPVQIVVYPNPVLAAQTLNVKLPEGLNEVNIDVYDINGKLVKQHPRVTTTLIAPTGTGIYVLKIQLPDGSITTEKIVVK